MYRIFTDGGANFGATVNLSNNAFRSLDPAVATSGDNVYVVWYDNTPGSFEIFTGGLRMVELNFGITENLSNNAGFSAARAVAASGNNVYVVWHDDTPGNFEILYKKSTDGGANFGATVNLSNNAGGSSNADIAVVIIYPYSLAYTISNIR